MKWEWILRNASESICTIPISSVQFSSFQSLSRVWPFAIPWIPAHHAFLSITNYWSLLKLMSIESVMTSRHLILCHPLLLLPPILPILFASLTLKWKISSLVTVKYIPIGSTCHPLHHLIFSFKLRKDNVSVQS